jgi:protoporphyrinogen oxidase
MHEPKNWSSAMVPDQSTTSLVLECFCTKDDHIWSMSDEEVGQRCIEDLEKKLKFIDSSEVIDFSCVRTLQAYPVYDLEYAEKNRCDQWLSSWLRRFAHCWPRWYSPL